MKPFAHHGRKIALLSILTISTAFAQAADHRQRARVITLQGFVAHGVNTYNDQRIADYSSETDNVPALVADPPIQEIGALDPGGSDASRINAQTDRNLPVATIREVFDVFNPNGNVDPMLFNRTLDEIGSSAGGYTDLTERVPRVPFAQSRGGDIYASRYTIEQPTVRDWEQISGQLRVRCRADGSARARVSVRNALPDAAYTLWEVGVSNPRSTDPQRPEAIYGVPFGGIPNILMTDSRGCAVKVVELNECPLRACVDGAGSCTSYVSAFYHWDGQIYGGAPAATFAGMPVGVVAANQMVWPTTGQLLQSPATNYEPKGRNCRRH